MAYTRSHKGRFKDLDRDALQAVWEDLPGKRKSYWKEDYLIKLLEKGDVRKSKTWMGIMLPETC